MNNVKDLLYNYYDLKFNNKDRFIYCIDTSEIITSDLLIDDFINYYLCDRIEKDLINKIEKDIFYKCEKEEDKKQIYLMFDSYINDITFRNGNCIILIKEN